MYYTYQKQEITHRKESQCMKTQRPESATEVAAVEEFPDIAKTTRQKRGY